MQIIGLDIGGTKITGVVFDGKKVVRDLTIVTPKNLFDFERSLLKLVDFLSVGFKITGVGIGMAGLVDDKSGVVAYSPNIKFAKNLKLKRFFRANGFKKVKIDNDANSFTRAELYLGQGKELNNFLALTLGTGVGGGIVINRKIYRGKNNSGGELGHVILDNGFFEASYKQARDRRDFKQAGRILGKALVSFINIFAPDAVIIGGGYGTNEAKKYLPETKKTLKKLIFNKHSQTKIFISKLKNAGAIGAALLF